MPGYRRLCLAAVAFACVACMVGCDHATKLAAETALRDHPAVPVVPGMMDLVYTENHGVAFSALERLSIHPAAWILVAIALAETAVVVALWLRRRHAGRLEHAGFALLVAGAIGNAIDRAARGHVVDFIHVRFWPVFNVADILVCVGLGLLFLVSMRRRRPALAP